MFFLEFHKSNRRKKYYPCNDTMISTTYNFFVLIRSVMIGFRILLIMTMTCANGLCKFILLLVRYYYHHYLYHFFLCKSFLFLINYLQNINLCTSIFLLCVIIPSFQRPFLISKCLNGILYNYVINYVFDILSLKITK